MILDWQVVPLPSSEFAASIGLNLPAAHGMHDDEEDELAYVPDTHGKHDDDPEMLMNLPALHRVQVLDETVEYVPASHAMQVAKDNAPGVRECLPAEHGVQVDDDETENVPATHVVQAVDELEYVPALHCKHPDEPSAPLYVPEVHLSHLQPLEPANPKNENPALQLQSLNPSLPAGELESAGQLTHVLAPDSENAPLEQLGQPAGPKKCL